jgi:prepilin signal peptidase PulO-like enzyme (type II secretory pathway)
MATDSWHTISFFFAIMLLCALYDLRHGRVPDVVVLPGILVVAILKALVHHAPWWQILLAPLIGFGVFWAVSCLSKGRLGLGDAKLSALMILALGAIRWIAAVALASAAGTLIVLGLILSGRIGRDQAVPFAPFLAVASGVSVALTPMLEAFLGTMYE